MSQNAITQTLVLIGIVAFIAVCIRADIKAMNRRECRHRAMGRLHRKTGWEQLDALNAEINGTYERKCDHD